MWIVSQFARCADSQPLWASSTADSPCFFRGDAFCNLFGPEIPIWFWFGSQTCRHHIIKGDDVMDKGIEGDKLLNSCNNISRRVGDNNNWFICSPESLSQPLDARPFQGRGISAILFSASRKRTDCKCLNSSFEMLGVRPCACR